MFWRKVEGKGKIPGLLAGASAQEKDGEIFIFGGANQRSETNELHKYNISIFFVVVLKISNMNLQKRILGRKL